MDIHVARQPIFTKTLSVYGYELLYRNNATTNRFVEGTSANEASSHVIINSFLGIGIDKLTGGRRAFINFTDDLLDKAVATLFPKDKLIIEILETVDPNSNIVEKCQELKALGYKLALDDFVFSEEFWPLIDLADIIKVDFLLSSHTEMLHLIHRVRRPNLYFLAEKIESREEYELALKMGFSLFQGYFFSRPTIVSEKDIRPIPLNYLRLMQEVNNKGDDMNFARIAQIIMQDVALSYKLLRLVNSVGFGFRRRIRTVIHALVALGTDEVRKWITLLSMMGINMEQTDELLRLSVVRAKFCEYMSHPFKMGKESATLFMMGLFSLMDVIMGHTIEEILRDVMVADEVRDALVEKEGPYMVIYSLMIAYEQGDWEKVEEIETRYEIREKVVSEGYLHALEWGDIVCES